MNRRVVCIGCEQPVWELVTDIERGDVICAYQFKGIEGAPDPQDGDPMICPHCGTDLLPAINKLSEQWH